QAQRLADLLVGLAVRDELQHLDLAGGQLTRRVVGARYAGAGGEQGSDGRGGVDAAVEPPLDAVGDDRRRRRLQQVRLRARLERRTHRVRVVRRGQYDQPVPPQRAQLGDEVQAAAVGQAQIQDREI